MGGRRAERIPCPPFHEVEPSHSCRPPGREAAVGLTLFAGDGFHPSATGTYLAAIVIYAQASHRSPVGISAVARMVSLSPGDIEALEGGAAEAIARYSSP